MITAETYFLIIIAIMLTTLIVTLILIAWSSSSNNGKYDLYNRILDDSEYVFKTTIKKTTITYEYDDNKENE